MALAALDLFSRVVADGPAVPVRLDALAVQHGGARLRVAAFVRAHAGAQGVVQRCPGAVQTPRAKDVIDGLPRREILGQQPPRDAAFEYVEDRVEHHAAIGRGAAEFLGLGEHGVEPALDIGADNGGYYLQNLGSGEVMDAGLCKGAPVVQNTQTNGLASQQWNLGLVARIGPLLPPELSVQQADSRVLLSWPSNYANWILQKQSGSGLSPNPQAWVDLTGVTTNSYSEPMTNGATFYRLKSP